MLSRRIAAQHAQPDRELMLNDLLRIKSHREMSLRRQMTHLQREQDDIAVKLRACQRHRDELAQHRQRWLCWSGVAMSCEILRHKRSLEAVFKKEQELLQYQSSLRKAQLSLRERQDELRHRMVIVMKKKEKLRSLLNDEHG